MTALEQISPLTAIGDRTGIVTTVDKPWGNERWWTLAEGLYVGKVITVHAGHRLSLQYHVHKDESMMLVDGEGYLLMGPDEHDLRRIDLLPWQGVRIPPGVVHRLCAPHGGPGCTVIEVSTPEIDDVVRLHDDYRR